jgi:hypothetical protein
VRPVHFVAATLGALLAAIVAAWTFAAGVNLYYAFHPVYFVATAIAFVVASLLGGATARAAGMRTALARPLVPAVLAVWIAAAFGIAWSQFPKPGEAAKVNRAVLRTVPVHPGLRFVDERTSGTIGRDGDFAAGFVNPPQQWVTTWLYEAPTHASAASITSWYVTRLRARGWHVTGHGAGGGNLFVSFARGRAGVDVAVVSGKSPRVDVSAAAG